MQKRSTTLRFNESKGIRLRTGISKVFWCDPANGKYNFESATMPALMNDKGQSDLCWFDELFRGGIFIPRQERRRRAVTLLLTGPPGTGKSTLATEMCVRLAQNQVNPLGGKTLYIASEAHPPWIVENVQSFGWVKNREEAEQLFDIHGTTDGIDGQNRPIAIRTLSQIAAYKGKANIVDVFYEWFGLERLEATKQAAPPAPNLNSLGVVVIDSLNSVADKAIEFEKLHNSFLESGPSLIIFILDSSPHLPVSETWEFASDIVVRLDKEYRSGYEVRTIEVVKARYQVHVWGKHQMKVYESQSFPEYPKKLPLRDVQAQRLRAHPYRSQGGIFVFPSIHYLLSKYKKNAPETQPKVVKSRNETELPSADRSTKNLSALLTNGLPEGHATAMIGDRGAHKSHFGYLHALRATLSQDGRALIISLRDDESMTRQTLETIRKQHFSDEIPEVEELIKKGVLQIDYYMPGYITPEEFCHRLLLSIYRMRKDDSQRPITLVFNSLDQITSRFPLCAEEKVFIPGIIQTLTAMQVTSIFVGADSGGEDESLRNLLSMAELILTTRRATYEKAFFLRILENVPELKRKGGIDALPATFQSTELTVVRHAGGHAAGGQGLLELVVEDSPLVDVLPTGLQLIPYGKTTRHSINKLQS